MSPTRSSTPRLKLDSQCSPGWTGPTSSGAIERQNAGDPSSGAFSYRERHTDGPWIWIECRGASVEWNESGVPTRIIGTDADITQRKLAEELLANTSRRLNLALEISSIGVFEADIDKNEVEWDDRLKSIYGIEDTSSTKTGEFWETTLHLMTANA